MIDLDTVNTDGAANDIWECEVHLENDTLSFSPKYNRRRKRSKKSISIETDIHTNINSHTNINKNTNDPTVSNIISDLSFCVDNLSNICSSGDNNGENTTTDNNGENNTTDNNNKVFSTSISSSTMATLFPQKSIHKHTEEYDSAFFSPSTINKQNKTSSKLSNNISRRQSSEVKLPRPNKNITIKKKERDLKKKPLSQILSACYHAVHNSSNTIEDTDFNSTFLSEFTNNHTSNDDSITNTNNTKSSIKNDIKLNLNKRLSNLIRKQTAERNISEHLLLQSNNNGSFVDYNYTSESYLASYKLQNKVQTLLNGELNCLKNIQITIKSKSLSLSKSSEDDLSRYQCHSGFFNEDFLFNQNNIEFNFHYNPISSFLFNICGYIVYFVKRFSFSLNEIEHIFSSIFIFNDQSKSLFEIRIPLKYQAEWFVNLDPIFDEGRFCCLNYLSFDSSFSDFNNVSPVYTSLIKEFTNHNQFAIFIPTTNTTFENLTPPTSFSPHCIQTKNLSQVFSDTNNQSFRFHMEGNLLHIEDSFDNNNNPIYFFYLHDFTSNQTCIITTLSFPHQLYMKYIFHHFVQSERLIFIRGILCEFRNNMLFLTLDFFSQVFFHKYIRSFDHELGQYIATNDFISINSSNNSPPTLSSLAHSLDGMLSNFQQNKRLLCHSILFCEATIIDIQMIKKSNTCLFLCKTPKNNKITIKCRNCNNFFRIFHIKLNDIAIDHKIQCLSQWDIFSEIKQEDLFFCPLLV